MIEGSPSIIHIGDFGKIICVESQPSFKEMNYNFQGFMDQSCRPRSFPMNSVDPRGLMQIPQNTQPGFVPFGSVCNMKSMKC